MPAAGDPGVINSPKHMLSNTHNRLSLALVLEARERIRGKVNRTPIFTSHTLDALSSARLFFKCENLQKCGAFKARGATNAVFSLSEQEASRGVVTHSSGNHAAALAQAAKLRDIRAYVVMPESAPKAKQASVRRYGGEVILCESTLEARESTAQRVIQQTGAVLIHPYNDLRVMAGQGTIALELLEDVPDLDIILCPVGGGGQLSGIAVAAKSIKPDIQVIGVEPIGADDASRSFKAGYLIPSVNPQSIAGGLLTSLGDKTFAEIRSYVHDIVTVPEEAIVRAMREIWEVMKLIVEPSGAVSYAALVCGKLAAKNKRIALILSGGNLDLDRLPWQIKAEEIGA